MKKDGRGKLPAKKSSLHVTNEEQATNSELADILVEEYGGENDESKEVSTLVKKENIDESKKWRLGRKGER
jgi:hypothetical protein